MNLKTLKLLSILVCASAAHAADPGPLTVWGGGEAGKSVYTDVYVPHIIKTLENNALAGYAWGGATAGTVENAQKVTDNPTNLAVGQLDILQGLAGTQKADGSGPYAFTILSPNIGPECLYLVTKLPGYATFGDFLGNAWQATVATGSDLSGSFGTLQRLGAIYPAIADEAQIIHAGAASDIIAKVKSDPNVTHGFFVMRPDPQSKTFKEIADAKLTIIPVVDFGLEGKYDFLDLKVANGGLFSGPTTVTTACTSVALITGDPASAASQAMTPRDQKRLKVTIERIGAITPDTLQPNISSWADMWDNLKSVAGDKAKDLMEASKAALEDVLAKSAN